MAKSSLEFISLLDRLLAENGVPYWIFGGWTVDFYTGRVRRPHGDVDILIWQSDCAKARELLTGNGFREEPLYHADEHTRFFLDDEQVDVIYLVRRESGDVVTPGRWADWPYPPNTFHDARYAIGDTRAPVVHPDCMADTYRQFDAKSAEAKLKAKHHKDFKDLLAYMRSRRA